MTANNSKSYLPYLNKLVDQYNNIHHHSIKKNHIDTDYFALTENIQTNSSKFKVDGRVRITKYKNNFSKIITTVPKTKTNEVENKIPNNSKYITTQKLNKFTGKKI